MVTIILAIILAIALLATWYLAMRNSKLKKELSKRICLFDDAPQHKEKESEFMYKRRCVLKLQDEIVRSNAIVEKDGKVELIVVER